MSHSRSGTREYGRRVYVEDKDLSHPEIMKSVPMKGMYDQRLEKQSEFEKPYKKKDYDDMQYHYPRGSKYPAFKDPIPLDGEWYYDIGCAVRCRHPLHCADPVKCYPMLYMGEKSALKFTVWRKSGVSGAWSIYTDWVYKSQITVTEEYGFTRVEGGGRSGLWPLVINAPEGGWNGDPFDPDRDFLRVEMTDQEKHVCMTQKSLFCYDKDCCTEDGYVAPTLDDENSDATIDESNPATITIQDGCAPYIWSVSGIGYSISPEGSSSLLSAQVTVVGGDCDDDYSVYCVVTVTDSCGNSVAVTLRNTNGSWTQIGGCAAGACDSVSAGSGEVERTGACKWTWECSGRKFPADPGMTQCEISGSGPCETDTLLIAETGCSAICFWKANYYKWTC